jgi:hypothetical protein
MIDAMASRRASGRLGCGAAVLLASLAPGWPATAQTSAPKSDSPADEDRRAALYHEGFDAATAGRWGEARDRFAAALAIRSSPKVLFSLAQAEEQLGQLATAGRDYAAAVEEAKAANEPEVVSAAQRALAAVDARVPKVRILVTGSTGATATLDDQPVAIGFPVPVDPGSHRIVVRAPGMRDAPTSVAISERQLLDVPVRLDGAPALAPSVPVSTPPAEARPAAPFPWRTVGLVTAGVGLIGVGVGSVFGLEAKSKLDQSNSSGCSGDYCTSSAAAMRRDAISAGDTSTVLFAVGGVLLAGGVALWLLAPSSSSDRGVALSPVALVGGGGGVSVNGFWR